MSMRALVGGPLLCSMLFGFSPHSLICLVSRAYGIAGAIDVGLGRPSAAHQRGRVLIARSKSLRLRARATGELEQDGRVCRVRSVGIGFACRCGPSTGIRECRMRRVAWRREHISLSVEDAWQSLSSLGHVMIGVCSRLRQHCEHTRKCHAKFQSCNEVVPKETLRLGCAPCA